MTAARAATTDVSSAVSRPGSSTVILEKGRARFTSYDDREVPFDLAVIVPLHGGAAYVSRSPGLGDELGFVPVDPHTLQAKAKPNVFAHGDATDVPASKAGSVAHFEGEVLAGNVRRFLAGEPLAASFDGTPTASSKPAAARPC